jgi:hypothetical protein
MDLTRKLGEKIVAEAVNDIVCDFYVMTYAET